MEPRRGETSTRFCCWRSARARYLPPCAIWSCTRRAVTTPPHSRSSAAKPRRRPRVRPFTNSPGPAPGGLFHDLTDPAAEAQAPSQGQRGDRSGEACEPARADGFPPERGGRLDARLALFAHGLDVERRRRAGAGDRHGRRQECGELAAAWRSRSRDPDVLDALDGVRQGLMGGRQLRPLLNTAAARFGNAVRLTSAADGTIGRRVRPPGRAARRKRKAEASGGTGIPPRPAGKPL